MNAEIASVTAEFVQRFSSTRRGARLARVLAVQQLDAWGVPFGTGPSDAVAHVVAELAANAVTHGHVAGRDFEVRLLLLRGGRVRIEVADTRGERWPRAARPTGDGEGGRGLLVVAALADAWGVTERGVGVGVGVGKVVWADLAVA